MTEMHSYRMESRGRPFQNIIKQGMTKPENMKIFFED